MVELELLQRGQRAVALLGEGKAPWLRLGERLLGAAEQRSRHEDDRGDGEQPAQDEPD